MGDLGKDALVEVRGVVSVSSTVACVPFEDMYVGRVFTGAESFGQEAMDCFAGLSGDYSCLHTQRESARKFGFPDRLQYGFLLASLLSRIVGTHFKEAVCAAVTLDFVKPAIVGERVDVRAEVTHVQETMRTILLRITMLKGSEVIVRGKLTTVFLSDCQNERHN